MQPLEEERDSELEPAQSARANVLEIAPEEERSAPLPRRVLLHAVMSACASPLAGGLLLAVRLISARRGLLAVTVLAAASAATSLGLAVALLAPVTTGTAAVLILAVWAVAGAAAAVFESRSGMAPPVPWASDPRPGLQALTWGGTLLVAGISLAFSLAGITTRWGMEILGKPSAPRQVLLMGLAALVPAGVLVGLARAALRRPHRLAPPVLFGAAFYLLVLSVAGAHPLWEWLARRLSRTEEITASEGLSATSSVPYALFTLALWLALSLHLAEARRSLDFVQRWVAASALMFLFICSFDVVLSDSPVSWRNRWAETAAAEARHADAARHWDWATVRAPRFSATAGMARKGAREALLAGDPGLAGRLLRRIDAGLAREHALHEEAATAKALLASRRDLRQVRSARVAPVTDEDYLSPGWNALLSAVRSVRPELGETEVKQRLQDLSESPTATSLPDLGPLLELKVVADLFDSRAVTFPYREKDRLLAAGFPVLVRLPSSPQHWLLVHWSAPGADAVLALDYGLWESDEKEDLDREEVARLLVGNEGPESRTARALARVSVLHADSRIAALLEREGGRAFALLPKKAPAAVASLPDLPAGLLTLDLARREMERQAFWQGLKLAWGLPPGPERDELLAWAWLSETGRSALAPEALPATESTARRLTAGPLGRISPWFLDRLTTLGSLGDPASCALRERVVRESVARTPDATWLLKELADRAAAQGRGAEAAGLALRFAAANGWQSASVLEAVDPLASMPGAGRNPAVRAAIEELAGRLNVVLADGTEIRPRSSSPAWFAARAALARDPDDAVGWWRRAVKLSPKSAPYRRRLADALESAGRKEAAAEARRWAASVDGVQACPAGGQS